MTTDTRPTKSPLTDATPTSPAASSPITHERVSNTDAMDRALHAAEAKFTAGLSPVGLALAWRDWAVHLANQPARRMDLARRAMEDWAAIGRIALGVAEPRVPPCPNDHRFTHPRWDEMPYRLYREQFLRAERWWHEATTGIAGVDPAHERIVDFMARQALDAIAPSNSALLNPEVTDAARTSQGQSVRDGLKNFIQDSAVAMRRHKKLPLEPGRDVAVTPGRVVYRNRLIELIQYAPPTKTVRPEPVLIVPAWIMKYYILDLSPGNSLVRYLTGQGYTVFMMSWHNPNAADRDLSLDDYRSDGVMAALDAVSAITKAKKIHATGYCLGGTLLSIAAAAMARDNDNRLASLSLFAAQTDFTEAGELQLFITEAQLAFLEDLMWRQGYLDTTQMAGAFQMLRSNDLIWSRMIRRYFIGEQEHPNDLMSWNEDATRMPYRMHAEYLRHLFLHNDLAEGRLHAGGQPVAISDITVPIFVVGTERDHIAPWHSVYKMHMLNRGPITFVLTSGGHNAGIVSEPGHPHRYFSIRYRAPDERYLAPEDWQREAAPKDGSWWPEFVNFLDAHSGEAVAPPPIGREEAGYPALEAAPGHYIHEM
ncbi:MAG: alpha/beta fold hydrolase [Acidiphilium sp.]|nr:alpha/beta fold hydrolase [Acidiphilium sp.]MDD4935989.1 alpha/beta fold hydrolase [Acidiphilium sp.]